MIGVYKENINTIPSLVIVDVATKDKALPLIIYFHGFTSAKEHNLPIAYLLAMKGYRVVLPDSKHHGERKMEMSDTEMQISFWDIIVSNVQELNNIKSYFVQKELLLNDRFGVAGTSMGGITVSAALTQYPWIKTAAILMGSPKITTYAKTLVHSFKKMSDLPVTKDEIEHLYQKLEPYDLSAQMDKLNERPLLFWHGENDSVVPFDHSYTFYDKAKHLYQDPDKIRFLNEANCDHKVSRYAILETVKWFDKYL